MKPGKLLTIAGLIVCICFTFWQKDNLKIIWGEYWTLHKNYYLGKEGWPVARIPAIKEKIAKTDPEAAAIVNYTLNPTSGPNEQPVDVVSRNIFKFPENQYFIYKLAMYTESCLRHGLDPAILLKLSNRLIELDEKNAAYRYLKAYALLRDRKGNDFDKVAEAIKQAEKCEYYKDPHLTYRARVMAIARKQGLPRDLIENLDYVFPYNFFVGEIYDTLIQYQNLLVTERNFAKADEISNVLKTMISDKMRDSFINNKPSLDSFRFYGLGFGFGRWNLPQEIELQRENLTHQEADKRRLELCAIVNPEKKVEFVNRYSEPSEKTQPYIIAVSPFIYLVRMTGVFIFLTIVLWAFSFSRKDNLEIKISKAGLARFLIYGFVCFLASQLLMAISFWESPCCSSYQDIFLFPRLKLERIKDLLDAPLYFSILPVAPLLIVLCMGIIRFFKPKFDNVVSRFICGILIAIQLGLAVMILQGYTYLKYLPGIIFILFAFKYSFRKITFGSIFKAFGGGCKNEIPILRTDLLKLSAIAAVLCWLGFVLLASPVKKSMDLEVREVEYYTYSFTQDYEKAYQEILNRIDDVNLPRPSVLRCIPLVKFGDLPQVMEKLKKRKFPLSSKMDKYFRPQGSKDYDELTEQSLSFLLRTAGRDQMPIVLNYMKNPDNNISLVFRAQLGDKSVKDKLLNLLDELIKEENDPVKAKQRYDSMEAGELEVVSALSAISKPDEAFTLFKEYFERHSGHKKFVQFVYEAICMLPRETVLKIQNLYLDGLENKVNGPNYNESCVVLSPLLGESEGLYLDDKTAARILSLFLRTSGSNRPIGRLGIEYYITSDAADLLISGLRSDNEELRAWCLWQLGKIGYKWNEAELRKIAEDKSWRARANLAIFDKSLIKEDEPSAYVKLIKSM